ncbi:Meiosis-specific protein HOP1 [Candida viswanathii]|uniref:Meiosis-specific protein HOP1 n=1 Tax=Candida viswanathii TaxID=5486 RepID=A0A367Y5E4_9ASCO|nr:Meiosis-specific protein HOP1 [Candida viswanathii]
MAVTGEESRNLVHELISISMYCITYLRNLFRETSYCDSKYFDSVDPDLNSSYICIKKLRKGASKTTDTFIDYIETGIYQAIHLKYLKGILFNIHASENTPFQSKESYLFGIDYTRQLVSINDEETISTDSITKNIHALVKRLIVLTQTLDTPTSQRFFTIRLLFNESCPPEYQPPFFQDASLIEPNVIRLEADSQGLQIGTLDTGESRASINVLVEKRSSDSYVDVDPFDLLADDYASFEDDSLNSLHLGDFLGTASGATQALYSPMLVKCKVCGSAIDPVASGYDEPLLAEIPCYDCMFKGDVDPDLVVLQKVRLLWNFYLNNDFPSFQKSLQIMDVTDKAVIRKVFQRMFHDGTLVVTSKATFATNSVEFQKGSGVFVPTLDGIIDNRGTEMLPNREYYVSFVPKLSEKLNFLSYDKKLNFIYFPNYKILKRNFVAVNLNKFKSTNPVYQGEGETKEVAVDGQPQSLAEPQNQSGGSVYSPTSNESESTNQSTPTHKETSPTTVHSEEEEKEEEEAEISHHLADLSFAESLQFLSQQLVALEHETPLSSQVMKKGRNTRRPLQLRIYKKSRTKKKKRKVSVNVRI